MQTGTVANCAQYKTGVGANGPWTLYEVTLADGQKARGFTFVTNGQTVELDSVQNGQYTNLNYKVLKDGAAPAQNPQPVAQPAYTPPAPAQTIQAPTPTSDPRALKLLVLIANQMAIDTNQINDILEGRQ